MAKRSLKTESVLAAAWFLFWIVAALFILPVAAAVLVGSFFYFVYRVGRDLPATQRFIARRAVARKRKTILSLRNAKVLSGLDDFVGQIGPALCAQGIMPTSVVGQCTTDIARALYEAENIVAPLPELPPQASAFDIAVYCDHLDEIAGKLSNPDTIEILQHAAMRIGMTLAQYLPKAMGDVVDEQTQVAPSPTLMLPLLDLIADGGKAVEALTQIFETEEIVCAGLCKNIRHQFVDNLCEMSELPPTRDTADMRKLIAPTKHKGGRDEIIRGYLRETPILEALDRCVPFVLPAAPRFEHHWILAGSGHGKTQTLQCLLVSDLAQVARGNASIIVIDSQGELISNIARLKLFAPGQPLDGRLCLIDPTDIEYPAGLNLFDVGIERINQYSPLDRERLMNGILELYDFVLTSLLSAELTQKQSIIFRYITRLMLQIPDATIHTFRELMEPKGYEKYRQYIERLDGTARAFFETEFNSKQFEDTKRQVVRRLWGVLENKSFERMFSHPRNKLDLFSEMNAGRVILINTAAELLKKTGTEIFGRFFIAMIAQAAQERATLPKSARLPVYVYVDEAADYLDQNVSLILEQMRKFNVGMVLAHQYIGQLTPKLFDSFAANTSIKFAGGVSDKDARAMAHMMRCSPEFIDGQPKGHFAAFVRNLTPHAVSLSIPLGLMERMERMTDVDFNHVRGQIRERYATHWTDAFAEEKRDALGLHPDSAARRPFDPTEPAANW